MKKDSILKKIPNISHIPRNEEELNSILLFLNKPKDIEDFYDFISIRVLSKDKLPLFGSQKKDSTERKWLNHLIMINLINRDKKNNKVTLTALSKKYLLKNINLYDLVLTSSRAAPLFNLLIENLITVSYLTNSFPSVFELYELLQKKFGYIDRPVSATRNLSGMINYLKVGNIIKKTSGIHLTGNIFLQQEEYNSYEQIMINFVSNNSKYGGYASVKDLISYLKDTLQNLDLTKIDFLIQRFIANNKNISFQEASSNKETGIFLNGKNILFVRFNKK